MRRTYVPSSGSLNTIGIVCKKHNKEANRIAVAVVLL